MSSSPVSLKDPSLAALLAFLVPGLGHLYQRRIFKGVLFGICILGTFFAGLGLGGGKVVYFRWDAEKPTWAYLCQFWTGLPALPGLMQSYLRNETSFQPNSLEAPLAGSFRGTLGSLPNPEEVVTGHVELAPQGDDNDHRQWTVLIRGTLQTSQGEVALDGLLTDFSIDPRVAPDSRRRFAGMYEPATDDGRGRTRLQGTLPRSLWNSFEAPLLNRKTHDSDETDLDEAHAELGTWWDLGVVYTMIAGLLNILAIYDALEGPAYGEEETAEENATPAAPPPPPAPATPAQTTPAPATTDQSTPAPTSATP